MISVRASNVEPPVRTCYLVEGARRFFNKGTEVDRLANAVERAALHEAIRCCAPHLAALVRFALATGCRASEITGLEWNRVDLNRRNAWLNQTKNGTPRGVPLNEDAIEVLKGQIGQHLRKRAVIPS